MVAVRNLPTLNNDSDQNISGEEYTNIVADTVDEHSKRLQEEVISVAGTAIAIIGTVATDPANFTYFQGKPLFFKALSASLGATEINIANNGSIPIKDMTGAAITADSWKTGDLVSGIIYGNQFRVFIASVADDEQSANSAEPITIFKQLVNIPQITLNSSVDEIFSFEGVQGVQGDILQFPNTSVVGSQSGESHHSINIYRDGVLIGEYIHIHSDDDGQGSVQQIITSELNYGHLYGALEITDGLPHDYIFKYDGSGTFYITFRGELSIARYSGPLIDGAA